jgi:hypothetical protein
VEHHDSGQVQPQEASTSAETERNSTADRLPVNYRGTGGMIETLSAGTSGIDDIAQDTAAGVRLAAQAAVEDAVLTARRLQRQQSRARYGYPCSTHTIATGGVLILLGLLGCQLYRK